MAGKEDYMRLVGTTSRGIRGPIIRRGDNVVDFVVDAVQKASENEGFSFHDRDVVCVTEALVARAAGNYATVDQIAADVRRKFPEGVIGVVHPILSRNRFAMNLKGVARGAKKIYLQVGYPSDEVGNALMTEDDLDESGINPWSDVLTEAQYREKFGENPHEFTGVDYLQYYRELIEAEHCEVEIFLANQPTAILSYTDQILTCDIHTRKRTKRILKDAGAEQVYNLCDILTESVDGSGFNSRYGLLGSNKATDESVKLFPEDPAPIVNEIARRLRESTGKQIEVMIYGDGAFRDPVGGIWELADPVVSPAYTEGLEGVPNELKIKFLADNNYGDLRGEELDRAIRHDIRAKQSDLKGKMLSEGTTPRRITDLLGSLADLTSGSGDKGTPIVLIQGYFDNLTVGE